MYLRQLLHITVSILLLVSTSGVIINKHYSGGKLFSSALYVEAESCCETSCCHHEHQNKCHEESDFYKLIADYTFPDNTEIAQYFVPESVFTELFFNTQSDLAVSVDYVLKLPRTRPPPPGSGLPVLFHSLLL